MEDNVHYREQNCFAGLLGQHYGIPVTNFGIPGGSLQSTIWTFMWWLDREPEPENCLVLIGLTDSDRFTYYDPNFVSFPGNPPWNRFVHSSWIESGSPDIPPGFRDLYKRHITLVDCPELRRLNYQQSVMTFDGVAARRNIPLLQFNIMTPEMPLDMPTLLWPDRNYCHWIVHHPEKDRVTAPGGHPNEIGHQMIRDHLIPEIDRVILSR